MQVIDIYMSVRPHDASNMEASCDKKIISRANISRWLRNTRYTYI